MKEIIEKIQKRLSRAESCFKELKELHGSNPVEKFNYYGGETMGYWKGRLSAFDDVLCWLEGMEGSKDESDPSN